MMSCEDSFFFGRRTVQPSTVLVDYSTFRCVRYLVQVTGYHTQRRYRTARIKPWCVRLLLLLRQDWCKLVVVVVCINSKEESY
jgi:hypothetical protein